MEEDTLEDVLARKYDITERLIAEGNFVVLCGTDKEAVNLVAAGISSSSFIVAGITLSGDEKDYDLISITSLSLLDLGIQDYAEKKIRVKSQFKPTQIYQLCSYEDQDRVWIRFVKIIDSLQRRRNTFGDYWQTVPLEASIPLSGVDMQSADHEHTLASSVFTDPYPWNRESDSPSSMARSASTTSASDSSEIIINLSRRTSSLPEIHTENFRLEKQMLTLRKGQSVDCLNITSKAPSVFSECENTVVLESKYEPIVHDFLNRSNNFRSVADNLIDDTISDSDVDNSSTKVESSFFWRLYRLLFCCEKSDK